MSWHALHGCAKIKYNCYTQTVKIRWICFAEPSEMIGTHTYTNAVGFIPELE